MAVKYILALLAVGFLGASVITFARGSVIQARTWCVVGVMFGLVSVWLFR